MEFIFIVLMLAAFALQCSLVPLSCSNNCLQVSNHTCEAIPCLNGCNPGWYGNNCNKACNQSCLYSICNQDDGTCTEENWSEPMKLRFGDRCLERDIHTNICICCDSKFRGDNCENRCDQCKTKTIRIQERRECRYFCGSGYYGGTCNKSCPKSCEPGNYGNPMCKEQQGVVKCSYGCPKGSYGNLCESSCNKECNNSICMQTSGQCVDCIAGYYGDFCDKICDSDCVDGDCLRNGSCLKRCVDDKICTGPCPKNCMELNGSICDNSNLIPCIHGCVEGFYGPTCEDACEDSCKTCNQNSGECVISHDTTLTESGQTGGSSAMIAGICVAAIIIIVLAVLVFVYIKKTDRNISGCCVCARRRRSLETGPSPGETINLRSPEEPSTSTAGEETSHLSSLQEPSTSTAGGRHDSFPSKGSVWKLAQHFERP